MVALTAFLRVVAIVSICSTDRRQCVRLHGTTRYDSTEFRRRAGSAVLKPWQALGRILQRKDSCCPCVERLRIAYTGITVGFVVRWQVGAGKWAAVGVNKYRMAPVHDAAMRTGSGAPLGLRLAGRAAEPYLP